MIEFSAAGSSKVFLLLAVLFGLAAPALAHSARLRFGFRPPANTPRAIKGDLAVEFNSFF